MKKNKAASPRKVRAASSPRKARASSSPRKVRAAKPRVGGGLGSFFSKKSSRAAQAPPHIEVNIGQLPSPLIDHNLENMSSCQTTSRDLRSWKKKFQGVIRLDRHQNGLLSQIASDQTDFKIMFNIQTILAFVSYTLHCAWLGSGEQKSIDVKVVRTLGGLEVGRMQQSYNGDPGLLTLFSTPGDQDLFEDCGILWMMCQVCQLCLTDYPNYLWPNGPRLALPSPPR